MKKYIYCLLFFASLWASFYIGHIFEFSVEKWWGLPFLLSGVAIGVFFSGMAFYELLKIDGNLSHTTICKEETEEKETNA